MTPDPARAEVERVAVRSHLRATLLSVWRKHGVKQASLALDVENAILIWHEDVLLTRERAARRLALEEAAQIMDKYASGNHDDIARAAAIRARAKEA